MLQLPGQFRAGFYLGRFYTDDFCFSRTAELLYGGKYVFEAEPVQAGFGGIVALEILGAEKIDLTGSAAGLYRIDDYDFIRLPDKINQLKARRPAVDKLNIIGNIFLLRYSMR